MAKPYELDGGAGDPVLYIKFDQAPVDPFMRAGMGSTTTRACKQQHLQHWLQAKTKQH